MIILKLEREKVFSLILTVSGGILIAVSFFFGTSVKNILLITAAIICAFPILRDAFETLKEKEIDESALLIIADAAALITGEFFEAAAVAFLFGIGELLEEAATDRSRKSIEALYGIIGETANLVEADGNLKKINSDEIRVGMKLAALPHELIPVDGVIYSGCGDVDTSALTGESIPIEAEPGTKLMSGYINGNSTLYFEAAADKNDSSAARIAEMVKNAAEDKGKAQTVISAFAKYYTPSIIIAAILLAVIPSLIFGNPSEWIHRALILLVASCPCAIVLSAPLAFFSSMGACAENGMIIKGSRYIESIAKADTVVFDKTGTLTEGELSVREVFCAEGYDKNKILEFAAKCEYHSSHPIAKAIVAAAGEVNISDIDDIKEIAAGGVSVKTGYGTVICGGKRLMDNESVDISVFPHLPVYVALNGKAVGGIEIESKVRSNARQVISALKKLGIKKAVILTGDSTERTEKIASECGIDEYICGLLPSGKLDELKKIKEISASVIYVGDGINDAPVLAFADVGTAMGLGTKAAGEAADLILTNSDLSKLPDTVIQSRRTVKVLKQNIFLALIIKLAVIILGIFGIAPMWSAVLADVGTMIICVINSSGLFKIGHFNYE